MKDLYFLPFYEIKNSDWFIFLFLCFMRYIRTCIFRYKFVHKSMPQIYGFTTTGDKISVTVTLRRELILRRETT